jgi:hypothetical protein
MIKTIMMEGVNKIYWVGLLILGGCLSACQWEPTARPSVLVIAVESLGFSLVPCQSVEFDSSPSGLKTLCDESVRFTHAFTPSVMSQAALASILTARYPHEHGVRTNGADFLSSRAETAAEAAHRLGYQTGMISGGAPILSKSGLSQGFDLFDDRVRVDLHHLYRPVQESFKLFLSWLDTDVRSRPYFAVIYVPDLQFPHEPTANDLGELRELSLQSQIREIDESLQFLFQQIHKRNLWENTHIIVTGLNGYSAEHRLEETKGFSLHSENTQVALFVKPAGKKRDLAMSWKVDSNVSLVDVGATLYDVIGASIPLVPQRQLEVRSLKGALAGQDFEDQDDRLILSESAWAQWHHVGGIRYATRRGQVLLMWDNPAHIFNTLTDPFELTHLTENDVKGEDFKRDSFELFKHKLFTPWQPIEHTFINKLALAGDLWAGPTPSVEVVRELEHLIVKRRDDTQLQGWLATWYMRLRRWPELMKLGQQSKNKIWEYVAGRNLGRNLLAPEYLCFQYVAVKPPLFQKVFPKKCEDDVFGLFLSWINAGDDRTRELYRERFLKQYRNSLIDQEVAEHNYANGLMWDVSTHEPSSPSLTQLALALPENAKYGDIIRRRMAVIGGEAP